MSEFDIVAGVPSLEFDGIDPPCFLSFPWLTRYCRELVFLALESRKHARGRCPIFQHNPTQYKHGQ